MDQLPSLRPLDELPLLQHLDLHNIPETTQTLTGVIGEWPSLESLNLYDIGTLDISAIRSLTGLTSLGILSGNISDSSGLTRPTSLNSIQLWGEGNLNIIGILPKLPALKEVTIHRAGVADLSPLPGCRLRIILYDTKPAGTDSPGFLPSVEQKSLSFVKLAARRVLGQDLREGTADAGQLHPPRRPP